MAEATMEVVEVSLPVKGEPLAAASGMRMMRMRSGGGKLRSEASDLRLEISDLRLVDSGF